MREALTAPVLVASLVLLAAGAAKLRRPATAARALRDAALPGGVGLVRAFALGELGLAAWAIVAPSRLATAALGLLFLLFTGLAGLLARRASACGCFGSSDSPASAAQSVLSASFALVAVLALRWPAHGLGWILDRSPTVAAPLLLGLLGAAYATVLAYTALPSAWSAWGRA